MHCKREEDATMESGKLDEELRRLSWIADRTRPRSFLLCNESFASTNEWEGSDMGREVIGALLQPDVRVLLVNHLFELARGYHRQRSPDILFLRAEGRPDGSRSSRVQPGEPPPTSYGKDLYDQILGEGTTGAPPPPERGGERRQVDGLPGGLRSSCGTAGWG